MSEYWSWILAVFGVSGMFVVGRKTAWGWMILLFNEVIWTVYALVTQQYGFIVMAVAYAIVYIKSFISWRKDHS